MRIGVRPFGDVPRPVLEDLAEDLAPLGTVSFLDPRPVPQDWLDAARGRYRADRFLDAIAEDSGDRVLAVTSVDLTAMTYNFVFGQARVHDRPAVVSIARLGEDDPGRLRERLAKEAVHELGHTFGLGHCEDRRCVMAFSNSLADTDHKTRDFCSVCARTVEFTAKRLRT